MQASSLALCGLLLVVCVLAGYWELIFHNMGGFCAVVRDGALPHCESVRDPEAVARCSDAVEHLEAVEHAASVWRLEVLVAGTLSALVASLVACSVPAPALFLATFFAAIALQRYRLSWEQRHVFAPMREARRQLLRGLRGLPDARVTPYV
jgi:hypothetical protein